MEPVPPTGDVLTSSRAFNELGPIRIRLLGTFAVDVGGRPVPTTGWRLRKAVDLVKLLALAPGRRLHREQAMELLWPDKDPAAGANNLYQAIHAARRALARSGVDGGGLELRDGVIHLGGDGGTWVDVDAFEDAVRDAAAGASARWQEARELYRGELLPDDPYADWAAARRSALAAAHRRVLGELIALHDRAGKLDDAALLARELVALDPLDEEATGVLMRLDLRAGHRGAALRDYEVLSDALRRELDAEPSEELVRLHRDIVEGRIDLERPRAVATNLPTMPTALIGRKRELDAIARLLESTRVLTLTGTGGTGKTRLAIEAARVAAAEHPDGVWLVELASVAHPALVERAVGDVLGVRELAGASIVERIVDTIRSRQVLLVLDNCEHLIEASATIAARLVGSCQRLRVMATSRQSLRIPGEVVFRVPSLPVPDPSFELDADGLLRSDAATLFVERARAADPGFDLSAANIGAVARLCYHLDGLPLAIELAASRVGSLPVTTLAERLDQRFELLVGGSRTALARQQTLRGTLDWSYELLDPAEQRVLRHVAVFAGGASPEAVEQVSGAGMHAGESLRILADLVDQSLVMLDPGAPRARYRLLDTVREYAHERLVEAEEQPAADDAHLAWAVALGRASRAASGPAALEAFGVLAEEQDNLRAALEHGLRTHAAEALELAESMWPFWLWDGHLAEGRRWLTRALDAASDRTATRAGALLGLAALLGRIGDSREHAERAREAATIFEELGDEQAVCGALQVLGIAPLAADDTDDAGRIFAMSLDLATRTGFELGRAAALGNLAAAAFYGGDMGKADRHLDASVAILRSNLDAPGLVPPTLDLGFEIVVPEPRTGGSRLAFQETFAAFVGLPVASAVGQALANQGTLAQHAGRSDDARTAFDEALMAFRQGGDKRGVALALARLGNLDAVTGRLDDGRARLEECLAIRESIGDSRGVGLALMNLGNLERTAGLLPVAEAHLGKAIDGFRRRGDLWGMAGGMVSLAGVALERGDLATARAWLEESLVTARTTDRRRWTAWILLEFGDVLRLDGRADAARAAIEDAAGLFRAIGDRQGEAATRVGLERLNRA